MNKLIDVQYVLFVFLSIATLIFFADVYCSNRDRRLANQNLQFLKTNGFSDFLANRPITFMNLRTAS